MKRTAFALTAAVSAAVVLAACGSGTRTAAHHAGAAQAARPVTATTSTTTSTVSTMPTGVVTPTSSDERAPGVSSSVQGSAAAASLPTAILGSWSGTKPRTIYFSTDGGNIVSNVAWSSWGATAAVGSGTWDHNNCDPDCAEGKVTKYPTTVSLSDPSGGHFTRLVETQSGPFGETYTFNLPDPSLGAAA